MAESLKERLEREKAANNISPPWAVFPDYTAFTIGWRMGSGEWWRYEWFEWTEQALDDYESRLSYFRNHPPAPPENSGSGPVGARNAEKKAP